MEFIVPVEYTLSVGIICRCVAYIASKKREEEAEDYELNFEELGERTSQAQEKGRLWHNIEPRVLAPFQACLPACSMEHLQLILEGTTERVGTQ